VDDVTGKVIEEGRYYQISSGNGRVVVDVVRLDDVLAFMVTHLKGEAKPYVCITTCFFDEKGRQGDT
jgi:hypothetical protein